MKGNPSEIRGLNITDVDQKIEALEKELFGLRYQSQTSRVEKPHRFNLIRKEIARCKTIIREKELSDARKQQ
ncbi:MAG: 50S ribosomal protein L29 [Candidatus Omnitrophica bacterium]|nr:50S ribosomal protein L29 [Candidatus Omnitrophota bacterium]